MAVNWTEEQHRAIVERGSNILVAAAAGSGKTAVLVERIVRRVCDMENPVPIHRFLVLTFTDAAAAEMKRKIASAMEERLRLEPDNQWIREQLLMVSSAHISTVHTFCKNMIQNNIHQTDLPADFSMIDEVENLVLQNQALERVLERYYRRIDKKSAFLDLTLGYGGTKTDDGLRSAVMNLYHYSQSLTHPEKWLSDAVKQYRILAKTGSITGTDWEKVFCDRCKGLATEVADYYRIICEIVDADVPSDHKYVAYFNDIYERFCHTFAPVMSGEASWETIKRCVESFEVAKAPSKSGVDEDVAERIKGIRGAGGLLDTTWKGLCLLVDELSPEKMERVKGCLPRVNVLKQLVRQMGRLHKSMKREKSLLDFGDLEHEMIRLLLDRKGNPTPIALQLRERFEEILVDEYQDTNEIQDTIFRTISKNNSNIFMVGDLKQSIYRFRNANPNIFAEKYRRYLNGDGGVCIRLFNNFRSRTDVVDGINGIFSGIMKRETGGVDYTPEEYLIPGAQYPETGDNYKTEVLVTDYGALKEAMKESKEEPSKAMAEAETVAKRIRKMVDTQEISVVDEITKEPRPVRLGDITILVRNKARVQEMEPVLNAYGIPTSSMVGKQYLDSLEVMTVLNFLQIIDNPRQDIPLLAVLRSGMFEFSPDELAEIRLCDKGDFYTALQSAAEKGNARVVNFLEILESLRNDAVTKGVGHLIFRICHELHYLTLVGAMPDGRVRQRNLNLLYERGEEFEQGSLHGLFHFMAYIDGLRKEKKDMKAGTDFSDQENTVNIMTVHKSKGLEFPVVILCCMDGEFNESDADAGIIWEEKSGIGMNYVDTRLRVKYPNFVRNLVQRQMRSDSRAEEMRIFYVALTRAKEKLILSSLVGTAWDGWKKTGYYLGGDLPEGLLKQHKTLREWTFSRLLSHPDCGKLRELAGCEKYKPTEAFPMVLSYQIPQGQTPDSLTIVERKDEIATETETKDMEERLSYQYPHKALGQIPVKLSISEIKRRNMPEGDYVENVLKSRDVVLSDMTEIGAAERGTITHYVMQHIDFSRTDTLEEIRQQLEHMVSVGLISEKQKSAVSPEGIYRFFADRLGQRLKMAERSQREFDFYMEIPVSLMDESMPKEDGEESVLLQGIADCFFYDGDGIVLIDYKTDRIPEERAEERAEFYRLQMEYYTEGLSAVLECPVKERYLYFLHCGKAVAI